MSWADPIRAVPRPRRCANQYRRGRGLAGDGRAGELRPDIDYEDVFWMLVGIGLAANEPGQHQRVGRLIELVIDALRPRAG
ncbi:hypothetical protein [Mycolicibacterium setense]|uniref:SbtR family transcriptional regulator n=1 Tax=Mycolicibacterium setense TaxID=431269 RepID=UPI00104255C7|nr:hypothetical protein [Mycolicibacterium setense]